MTKLHLLLPLLIALGVRAPNGGAMPCWIPESSCSDCCPIDVCPIVLDCVPALASACTVRAASVDAVAFLAPSFTLAPTAFTIVALPSDRGARAARRPLWLVQGALLL